MYRTRFDSLFNFIAVFASRACNRIRRQDGLIVYLKSN